MKAIQLIHCKACGVSYPPTQFNFTFKVCNECVSLGHWLESNDGPNVLKGPNELATLYELLIVKNWN